MTQILREAELIAAVKKGRPESREEALHVLALMMAAGRVKIPSSVSTKPSKDGGMAAF